MPLIYGDMELKKNLLSEITNLLGHSAGFTIVLRCAEAQGLVGRGGGAHLPANFFLRWIFAYVVQF
jgi:hypothetical protein